VAVTVTVPETVNALAGESTDRVPLVCAVMPVKVSVSLSVKVIGVTATWIIRLWESAPLVPVTFTLYRPVGVLVVVEMVRVELPPQGTQLILGGPIDRVRPAGVLAAVRLTVPGNPLMAFADMVDVPEEPLAMLRSTGLAVRAKSTTFTVRETVCHRVPLVALAATV